jgi:hypothetical protein
MQCCNAILKTSFSTRKCCLRRSEALLLRRCFFASFNGLAREVQKLYEHRVEQYGDGGRLQHVSLSRLRQMQKNQLQGPYWPARDDDIADDVAKKLIHERARVAELFSSAVNSGIRTRKRDGMEKVLMGLTDLKMVRLVCIKYAIRLVLQLIKKTDNAIGC